MDHRPQWLVPGRVISRRQLILGGTSAAAMAAFLAACGSDDGGAGSGTTAGGADTTAGGGATTAAGGADTTAAAAGSPQSGGTLRVGVVGSTNDIVDGQFIVAKADQARLIAGWEPLVSYDADFNVVYENALAEEIETTAADLYVIRLKEGIVFHNGKPVTADDVIYSFQRRLDPDLGLAPALIPLLDASGLTKVDDRTVQVQLKQPAVTFINGLAEYIATVVPVGYTREDPVQIGTGPFQLESFTAGAESVHKKNPNYWDTGKPYLDEVQIIDFADPASLVNALSSGDVDAIVDVPFAQASTISADSNLVLLESEAGSWLPITMAVDQAPFTDPKVRQAMRLIVDREQMVERVLSGHGRVANDMYGVFDACYPDDFPQRTQDIEQAKQLLADAGQEGLEIDLFAPDDTAGLPELAAAFADQAKEAGVTVNVKVLDGGTYWGDEYTKRTFATSFWGTRPYLNQVGAGSLKESTYPETHWPPEGSNFEALYFEALAETDDAARCEIIRQMQQQEYDEGGNIIAVFNSLLDAHKAEVQGLVAEPNVLNLDHFGRGFKNIWLQT
ncbi:MAG TPA: ABC transporter substrate-binding protein [Acidimicrobiales bacterium]|nr:ABC transporter substrate-binding protein [Acidimicrobiales bacterium]